MPSGYIKNKEKWKRKIFSQPCISTRGDARGWDLYHTSKQHTHMFACMCCRSQVARGAEYKSMLVEAALSTTLLSNASTNPRTSSVLHPSRISDNQQETNKEEVGHHQDQARAARSHEPEYEAAHGEARRSRNSTRRRSINSP